MGLARLARLPARSRAHGVRRASASKRGPSALARTPVFATPLRQAPLAIDLTDDGSEGDGRGDPGAGATPRMPVGLANARAAALDALGALASGAEAEVVPLVPDGASWLLVLRGAMPPPTGAFDSLWARRPDAKTQALIHGRWVDMPRLQQAFGVDYVFSGQTSTGAPFSAAPEVDEVRARLCRPDVGGSSADRFNGALVNFYADGSHCIGAHSDTIKWLVPGEPIITVSWGATRAFQLFPRPGAPGGAVRLRLELRDGDVLAMGGTCQLTHKHAVPRTKRRVGPRISLTFRCHAPQQRQ